MSQATDHALAPMVRTLNVRNDLSSADVAAVLSLPFTRRKFEPGHYLVWDGDRPQYTCLLLGGYAIRHKEAGDGGRQIVSIHMMGDIVDLQNSLLGTADHNVQMLTAGEVALIPVENMRELAFEHPSVGMAMWYETLVEGSIFREWILNIGRRDARTRIAHLLCEFVVRYEAAGLGGSGSYELPITQEQLADAVALTTVHVNRTLMKLEEERLRRREVRKGVTGSERTEIVSGLAEGERVVLSPADSLREGQRARGAPASASSASAASAKR